MATTSSRANTVKYWQNNRERVLGLNKRAASAIKKRLRNIPLLEEQLCISAIGSDGRLEKGLDSKLELQILHKDLNVNVVREVDMMLREIEMGGQPMMEDSETEVKALGSDSMGYAFSKRSVPCPARLLDSFILFGNNDLRGKAKALLVQELSGKEGKRLLKKLRERNRLFRGITESGVQCWKGQEITHYDLEAGVSNFTTVSDFEGNDVQVRGFKHGPLRYVQGVIEQSIVVFARSMLGKGDPNGAAMVLSEMPTPTVEKLEYLQDVGVATISPEAISEAADCYLRFLQLYHMAEWMAAKGTSQMRFDAREARSRINTILQVLEGGIVEGI